MQTPRANTVLDLPEKGWMCVSLEPEEKRAKIARVLNTCSTGEACSARGCSQACRTCLQAMQAGSRGEVRRKRQLHSFWIINRLHRRGRMLKGSREDVVGAVQLG